VQNVEQPDAEYKMRFASWFDNAIHTNSEYVERFAFASQP